MANVKSLRTLVCWENDGSSPGCSSAKQRVISIMRVAVQTSLVVAREATFHRGLVASLRAGALLLLLFLGGVAGAQVPGDSEAMVFQRAQAAAHEGNYAQAEKLYGQILASDPGSVPARVNLGLAYYWQHKNREAVSELRQALEVSPREFSARLFLGLSYLDLGEYDHAQRALQQAARIKDMDPLLFWALGSLAMNHGDANSAVPFLERSVALDPNNVQAVWLLGQAYARLAYRQDEEKPLVPADYAALVAQALRWVEQKAPDSALLHVFKGDVLSDRMLTSEALSEYQQALTRDPNWPDIHLMLGSLLGVMGRSDDAVRELKMQLERYPGDTRALVEMGDVLCRAGKYAAAVPYLEKALARDRDNYDAHCRLGQAQIGMRQYSLALPNLERATEINPEKSEAYYLLHRAYRAMNLEKKAAWALEQFNLRKAAIR